MRNAILFQSNCIFDVLEDMIRGIPSNVLNAGDKPREVLGRQALHILGVFDRYSTKGHSSSKPLGETHGTFSRRRDAEDLPTRRDILSYLRSVKAQFAEYISNLSDEFFNRKVNTKRGRFSTKLGKYIYMIRHNTLHLGYMRNMMIDRGYKVAEFK